jgi:hypothetical protein
VFGTQLDRIVKQAESLIRPGFVPYTLFRREQPGASAALSGTTFISSQATSVITDTPFGAFVDSE